ncbi:hypothetical protein [Roseiconus lacunae]|uniref:Uncharacterized protein n=1 Tax=Roseiconus lacunae TaxID=2605694 RepID=A0ABT7PFK2_9BACT|nr:hypothetical protein [Roseiconus lacunae]MDM4015265.1 hypothetical protein [Roseiconus lacunae]
MKPTQPGDIIRVSVLRLTEAGSTNIVIWQTQGYTINQERTQMNGSLDISTDISQSRWNAGGWFGGAIGSSAWMVIIACFLIGFDQTGLAIVPVICFAITMTAAVMIWYCRARISVASGMLTLIGVLTFTIPITWFSTSLFANDAVRASMNWPSSPIATLLVLFTAPAVGLWMLFVETRRTS